MQRRKQRKSGGCTCLLVACFEDEHELEEAILEKGMMKRSWVNLFWVLLAVQSTMAVHNPISPSVCGSVVYLDGEYYGMSAQTNGVVLRSTDLVHWNRPAPLTGLIFGDVPDEYNLYEDKGLFFLVSKNQGYSSAVHPLGPYSEWRKIHPQMGTDPGLFRDSTGQLFTLTRKSGAKGAGEIWLYPSRAPMQAHKSGRLLLDGRRKSWDSLVSPALGDPLLFEYRDVQYLLYGQNEPSPRSGFRNIGWARVKDELSDFGYDVREPSPAFNRNYERIERELQVILPTAELNEWDCRYSLTAPLAGWQMPGFKPSGWRTAAGGFGFPRQDKGAQIIEIKTEWRSKALWVRREFDWRKQATPSRVVLKIRHEAGAAVYLNGIRVYQHDEPLLAYAYVDITEHARRSFRETGNVLAAYATAANGASFRFLDFGLFGGGEGELEPAFTTVSSPSLVTGPNGFEKWLLYKGYWNGVLGSGLDRLYFHDRELKIDGPSSAKSKGYKPGPARPTFSDRFDGDVLAKEWNSAGGRWRIENGKLIAGGKGFSEVVLSQPGSCYLFETTIQFPGANSGPAGVIAYRDGNQGLAIFLDPKRHKWGYSLSPSQPNRMRWIALPRSFSFRHADGGGVGHRMRVEKNGTYFEIYLDGLHLTQKRPLMSDFPGVGVPGLIAEGDGVAFDGVVYTLGWDEYGKRVNGWGAAADGTPVAGEWIFSPVEIQHGAEVMKHACLEQRDRSKTPAMGFKGDLLDAYEFTVNARLDRLLGDSRDRFYGVFPVFVDRDNYLRAVIDSEKRELLVTGRRGGRELRPKTASLKRIVEVFADFSDDNPGSMTADTMRTFAYGLPSESVVSRFDVSWRMGKHDFLRRDLVLPWDDITIGCGWVPVQRGGVDDSLVNNYLEDVSEWKVPVLQPSILNVYPVNEIKGNYLGFGLYGGSSSSSETNALGEVSSRSVYGPLGGGMWPHEVLIHLELESSYFFRCIKLADRVIIELNGEPMLELEGAWPPSQVGLFTQGTQCYFDGITLMHLPDGGEQKSTDQLRRKPAEEEGPGKEETKAQ
jgi:hypothetical protein